MYITTFIHRGVYITTQRGVYNRGVYITTFIHPCIHVSHLGRLGQHLVWVENDEAVSSRSVSHLHQGSIWSHVAVRPCSFPGPVRLLLELVLLLVHGEVEGGVHHHLRLWSSRLLFIGRQGLRWSAIEGVRGNDLLLEGGQGLCRRRP